MVLERPESEVRKTLEILDKEMTTSERIISSLLDFARGSAPVRWKVDVSDIVQKALPGVAVTEAVEVVSRLDDTPPAVWADPDQLTQVFGSIILNAIQALPGGGQLTITSRSSPPRPRGLASGWLWPSPWKRGMEAPSRCRVKSARGVPSQ